MEINRTDQSGIPVLYAQGKLDFQQGEEFDKILREIQESDGVKNMVLEFSQVTVLSSPSLRAILSAAKRAKRVGGKIAIAAASEAAFECIRISGFHKMPLFVMVDQVDQAVTQFGGQSGGNSSVPPKTTIILKKPEKKEPEKKPQQEAQKSTNPLLAKSEPAPKSSNPLLAKSEPAPKKSNPLLGGSDSKPAAAPAQKPAAVSPPAQQTQAAPRQQPSSPAPQAQQSPSPAPQGRPAPAPSPGLFGQLAEGIRYWKREMANGIGYWLGKR